MKTIGMLAAALLLALPALALPDIEGVTWTGCHDGDTCYFLVDGTPEAVRLRGIDTPELKARCAEEGRLARAARNYLEWHLARAQRIDLREVGLDRYKRLLARVVLDGTRDATALLLTKAKERGFARPWTGRREPWCPEKAGAGGAGGKEAE